MHLFNWSHTSSLNNTVSRCITAPRRVLYTNVLLRQRPYDHSVSLPLVFNSCCLDPITFTDYVGVLQSGSLLRRCLPEFDNLTVPLLLLFPLSSGINALGHSLAGGCL